MLLRVAAVAGASALAAACSNGTSGGTIATGVLDSGSFEEDATTDAEAMLACGGHACGTIAVGSVAVPPDASLDAPDDGPPTSYADALGLFDVLPARDAGEDADAKLPCGTGVCGTIVMPQDAARE